MSPNTIAKLAEALPNEAIDEDEREHLSAMLDEARTLVTRLETLLSGSANSPAVHPIVGWRKRRNMPQRELARIAGITPPALCRIEHSPGFKGRKETRAKIAKALDVPEEWLIAPDDFLSPNSAGDGEA